MKKETIKKILIIRYKTYGDVFITSSVFEALKKHFPESRLYYLVQEPYQIAVINHPFLDEIITFKRQRGFRYLFSRLTLFKMIRKLKFDLVIDYQNTPGTRQLSFFSEAKYRVGNDKGQYHFLNNIRVAEPQDRYSGSLKFDMLLPLGIKEEVWKFHFHIDNQSQSIVDDWLKSQGLSNKNFIVITPGSAIKEKIWRLENYALLGDMIFERFKLPIVLQYAPNELVYCQKVSAMMKNKPILAPELDLTQAVALVKRAKLLICNDSAINHLSCATETETIAIFGNTDKKLAYKKLNPQKWSPHSIFSHHHLLYKDEVPSIDDSFGISPKDVFERIKVIGIKHEK